jgi:hypothetical protein
MLASSSSPGNKGTHVVQATAIQEPQVVHATEVSTGTTAVPVVVEGANIGICRRCRQQFVRRPDVHDGMAQYYRCEDCEKLRIWDMIEGSCRVC